MLAQATTIPSPGIYDAVVGPVADRIYAALLPRMKDVVAEASVAAQPTISRVVREDVMPWAVGGILAVGALAALIGAAMARVGR